MTADGTSDQQIPGQRNENGNGAGAALAHALAWAALGLEASVLLVVRTEGRIGARLAAALWNLGHAAALGLISAAAVAACDRLLPRRAVVRYAAVFAAAFGVGLLMLPDDLAGAAGGLGGERWVGAVRSALIGGAAAAIPLAGLFGHALARRGRLRLVGAALGVCIVAAHAWVLAGLYPGLHFYAAWTGAVLAGASLRGWSGVDGLIRRLTPRRAAIACVPAAGLALFSVLVRPPAQALVKMVSFPGAVSAPYVARIYPRPRVQQIANLDPEWFSDRSNHAPIPPTPERLLPPDGIVVFLTGECQRADLLERPEVADRLPNLWRLARQSVHFTNARSPSPATGPTIAAIFSGKYYSQLYWTPLAPGEGVTFFASDDHTPRFPANLSAAGIDTLNLVGQRTMVNRWGHLRGFAEELTLPSSGRASALVDAAIARLQKESRPTKPLFIYGHFKEGHGPYRGSGKTEWDKYVSDLGQVDKQIGRLLGVIDRPELAARTTLIVTADHGEAFGEHGLYYHGTTVYEELLRVTLLARVPGVPSRREDRPVSTMDLGPTILDLFGLPTPGHHMGQSLVPYLLGRPGMLTRPIVADSGRRIQAIVFADGIKVIFDRRLGTSELYDLSLDPRELETLTDRRPDLHDERLNLLNAFFEVHELRRPGYTTPFRP